MDSGTFIAKIYSAARPSIPRLLVEGEAEAPREPHQGVPKPPVVLDGGVWTETGGVDIRSPPSFRAPWIERAGKWEGTKEVEAWGANSFINLIKSIAAGYWYGRQYGTFPLIGLVSNPFTPLASDTRCLLPRLLAARRLAALQEDEANNHILPPYPMDTFHGYLPIPSTAPSCTQS